MSTTTAPEKVPFTESELVLAEVFGKDRDMLQLVHRCPQCKALILVGDNNVWLDARPLEPGGDDVFAMGMIKLGELTLAASPGGGEGGSRHALHDHQPPEEY